jgi:hypothetical protein
MSGDATPGCLSIWNDPRAPCGACPVVAVAVAAAGAWTAEASDPTSLALAAPPSTRNAAAAASIIVFIVISRQRSGGFAWLPLGSRKPPCEEDVDLLPDFPIHDLARIVRRARLIAPRAIVPCSPIDSIAGATQFANRRPPDVPRRKRCG